MEVATKGLVATANLSLSFLHFAKSEVSEAIAKRK